MACVKLTLVSVAPLAAIHKHCVTALRTCACYPPCILSDVVLHLLTIVNDKDWEGLCSATKAAIRRTRDVVRVRSDCAAAPRHRVSLAIHLCPCTRGTVFATQYRRRMSRRSASVSRSSRCRWTSCAPPNNHVKAEGGEADACGRWVFLSDTIGVSTDRSLRVYD